MNCLAQTINIDILYENNRYIYYKTVYANIHSINILLITYILAIYNGIKIAGIYPFYMS